MANPLEELIARHGQLIGYVPVNPTIEKKVGTTTVTVPNPNPSYKYIFADGTWAGLRPSNPDNPTDTAAGSFMVTDPGTAYKATAEPTPGEKAKDDYEAAYYGKKGQELREPAPTGLQPRYEPGTGQRTYVPGMGSVEVPGTGEVLYYYDPETKTKYDPEDAALDRALRLAQIAAQNRSGMGDPTSLKRLLWDMQKYPEETEYARSRDAVADLKAQQDRDAENMRNQLTNRSKLFDTMSAARERNLQWQLPDDVEYMPLMEPGGAIERMLPGFKPQKVVRVPWDQISGEEIWKRTRGMTGG